MRSHFNIPSVVRYQPFEKYYTIRMLIGGCLPTGDKLFTNILNTYRLKDIKVNADGKLIEIDHYHIKGYFYDTADFGISYTPPADMSRPEKSKQSIKFRVSLNGTKVGGSLNYNDLGLTTDAQVIAFSKLFDGLANITPVNDASTWFANKLMKTHEDNIYRAMAREIQEECTPNRANALSIDEIVPTLTYDGVLLEQRETWQTMVNLNFTSSKSYKKVREMDEFCCEYKGRPTKIYYIYGEGDKSRGARYTSALPFIPALSKLQNAATNENNENNKLISNWKPPPLLKMQPSSIKRMSMPSLSNIHKKSQKNVPIISSLQNAANNWNNGLIPNWKPLPSIKRPLPLLKRPLPPQKNISKTKSNMPSKTGPQRTTRRKK